MMIDVECLCCNLWMATKNAMTWCHCRFFPPAVDSYDHNPGLAICPKHVGCHLRRELFPQAAINLSSGVEILMKSHTNKPLPTMLERSYQSAVPWCLCIPDIHPHQDYSLRCAYDLIDCAKRQCSWRRLRRALHGKHPKLHKPRLDSRPWKVAAANEAGDHENITWGVQMQYTRTSSRFLKIRAGCGCVLQSVEI